MLVILGGGMLVGKRLVYFLGFLEFFGMNVFLWYVGYLNLILWNIGKYLVYKEWW